MWDRAQQVVIGLCFLWFFILRGRGRGRGRGRERASERGQREKGRVSESGWGRVDRGEREDFFFFF
jgi:hypothetical protein